MRGSKPVRIQYGMDGYSVIQSSSNYPAPDTPAIPIQRHFFEMIRSEKKKCKCKCLVYSSLSVSVPGAINFKF